MSTLISQGLRSRPDQEWPGHRLLVHEPLRLDCGVDFGPFTIAYPTYGKLNPDRTNAILVCHALTGDQYVADPHPITDKPGWWETMVGPGLVLDTDRYFIVCANVLGGCMGTTGPQDINPATGDPWALSFPVITVRDMVRAQKRLLDHLGIDSLFCVTGGSVGGELSGMCVCRRADRGRGAPLRPEYRLPRGRAPGDHGRPGVVRRTLSQPRPAARPRPRGRPHGSPHHLSFRAGAAPQVRAQSSGSPRRYLWLRRRLPSRKLSAPPGQHFCRPLRRELVSVYYPGDGLFRSRRRARGGVGERVQGHALALLHHL